ncbi:hypothetical protein RM533_12020 [Croceicoccus sp. F390]|uniref:Uncharacterized protein n=1 Tax=Croceicoccus esteveae TaxID=3075597 RepID=A0ABU2ZJW5_9SPHN|nr:hypothetical protein [Croceicoccus sp. F390]MDT0576897.1 hypothetical protein [Croceicoccus sp. F390]
MDISGKTLGIIIPPASYARDENCWHPGLVECGRDHFKSDGPVIALKVDLSGWRMTPPSHAPFFGKQGAVAALAVFVEDLEEQRSGCRLRFPVSCVMQGLRVNS